MTTPTRSRLDALRDALRPPVPLQGQVVLVTGASAGIGRAAAEAFAAEGARVVLAARRQDELEALAAALRGRGAEVAPIPTDITRDDDLARLVDKAIEAFGRIDVLVNNAGVARGGLLHELDAATLHAILNVNLHGTFRLTQLALPHLVAQRSGHVVLVSSVAAYAALPALSVYSATKAALVSFANSMRRELAGTGVRVSAVLPAATRTAMMEDALGAYEAEGAAQPMILRPLLQRIVGPEVPAREIVDAVRYRRREVILGGPSVSAAVLVEKLFPRLLDAAFARMDPETVAAIVARVGG